MHKGGDSIQSAGQDTDIVFVYEPTPADYEAALRRYVYRTWPGRRGVLIPSALITVLVLCFAEVRGFSPAIVALLAAAAVVTAVVTTIKTLTRVAREQHTDMEDYGTCRTVVADDGLTTTGGTEASTIDWQAFPWYLETDELFALTTVKTRIFFVIPKRGAQNPAHVDALRTVLDHNLRRL